jgi:hypothetical protein
MSWLVESPLFNVNYYLLLLVVVVVIVIVVVVVVVVRISLHVS